MNFLKTLFWVTLAVVAVIFASNNWTYVPVTLWGGLQPLVRLPVLLLAAFLLGFLPIYAVLLATRWRLRRRLDASQRTVAEVQATLPIPDAEPSLADPRPAPTVPPLQPLA